MKLILAVHIVAGTVALLSMWVPILSRKGGKVHRRAGLVFVWAMAVVSATALFLSGARLATDPSTAGRQAALFLMLVAVLTGAGVSAGVRVLDAKRRTSAHRHRGDLAVAWLLLLSGLAGIGYGVANRHVLFIAFAALATANGVRQLLYWGRAPVHPMHWWFEHLSQMLGACIAATTAFLVVNAERWGLGTFSLVLWLAPTIVGTPAILLWSVYYRRRFARAASSSRHPARDARVTRHGDT